MPSFVRFLFFMRFLFFVGSLSCLAMAAEPAQLEVSQAEEAVKDGDVHKEIARLLSQLDADSFAEREAATEDLRKLVAARPSVWQYLVLLDPSSPEVAFRIRRVVRLLKQSEGVRSYQLSDWDSKPLSKSWCSIYQMPQGTYGFTADHDLLVGRLVSNDAGEIKTPAIPKGERWSIVVHSEDYGVGGAVLNARSGIQFPLAKIETKAASRSARGQIVDVNGDPIAYAIIRATGIMTSSGGVGTRWQSVALSDGDGRFRCYNPPVRSTQGIVPPTAKFVLAVSHRDYFPTEAECRVAGPTKIVLRKGRSKHGFTFAGRTAKRNGIFRVTYSEGKPDSRQISLPVEYLTSQRKLLHGTYQAHTNGAKFKSLVVNESSPAVLDFEYSDAKSYSGAVYDGITGEPIDGAFVLARSTSKEKHFNDLTKEQLARLQDVDPDVWHSHPALVTLNEITDVMGVAKTDWTGEYTLTLDEPVEVHSLVTLAPGMLPFEVRAKSKDGLDDVAMPIELDDMFHFASARVAFRPELSEETPDRVSIWPEWKLADESKQPSWFGRFKMAFGIRQGQRGFRPSCYWVRVRGERRTLDLPADIKLDLLFTSTHHQDWAPVRVDELQVKASEERDIGELKVPRTFPIRVRVVDHMGAPVEGIDVRHKYDITNGWHVGRTTGEDGEVKLGVGANLKGEFGLIELRNPAGKVPDNLRLPVEINGSTTKVFEIKLTAAQTRQFARRVQK